VSTGFTDTNIIFTECSSYNIEGYNYDDTQTAVSLLLADQFGNPVADNTPVVFQTDSGAIGSASRGGCNTQNGDDAVTFRSQNPRYNSDAAAPKTSGSQLLPSLLSMPIQR
jgi:hypothetical protein